MYNAPQQPVEEETLPSFRDVGVDLVELEEEEILLMDDGPAVAESLPKHMKAQAAESILLEEEPEQDGAFSPQALQRYGFEALIGEIRRAVRQEVENELGVRADREPAAVGAGTTSAVETSVPPAATAPEPDWLAQPAQPLPEEWPVPVSQPEETGWQPVQPVQEDWLPQAGSSEEDWFAPDSGQNGGLDSLFEDLFAGSPAEWDAEMQPEEGEELPEDLAEELQFIPGEEELEPLEEELPLAYEVTLDQLIAMV